MLSTTASAIASRASPSYGIKYVSASNQVRPVSIKPIATTNRGLQDFHFLKFLNKGDSGTVYLVRDIHTSKEYALKVMPKTGINLNDAANEHRIQRMIETDGPSFLLPVLASFHDSRNYYMITEYMRGGDMAIELARCGSFDEDRAKFYGAQMILAVEEMKAHRVIHRDIKPTNILIDHQGHLRLTDFGFAKKFDVPEGLEDLDNPEACFSFDADANCESGAFFTDVPNPVFKTSEICGTPQYMSPQRIAGKEYGDQEDLWSVGVVLFMMFTGRMPFGKDHKNAAEVAFSIKHLPLEFTKKDFVSDNAKALLIGMLTKDTRSRLSLEQVKQHAFFKGIDWDRVKNHGYEAQWIPFLAPLPKKPMANVPNVAGGSYEDWLDPLPSYTYTSPKMNEPKPTPPIEKVKRRSLTFKDIGSAVTKMLRSGKKEDMLISYGKPVYIPTTQVITVNRYLGEKGNGAIEKKPKVQEEIIYEEIKMKNDHIMRAPYTPAPRPRAMIEQDLLDFRKQTKLPPLPARLVGLVNGYKVEQDTYTPPPTHTARSPIAIHHPPIQGITPAIYLQPSESSDIAVAVPEVPEACSAVVEIWEETGVQNIIRPARSHLTVIEEEDEEEVEQEEVKEEEVEQDEDTEEEEEAYDSEDMFGVDLNDFPLPPGYKSFDDRQCPQSPITTPPLSPTPTVYAPVTPVSSPTPTLVDQFSPPTSRSPSPLKRQARVDTKPNPALLAKRLEKEAQPTEKKSFERLDGYKIEHRHIYDGRPLRGKRMQEREEARRREEDEAFEESERKDREIEEARRKARADEEAKREEETKRLEREAEELLKTEEDKVQKEPELEEQKIVVPLAEVKKPKLEPKCAYARRELRPRGSTMREREEARKREEDKAFEESEKSEREKQERKEEERQAEETKREAETRRLERDAENMLSPEEIDAEKRKTEQRLAEGAQFKRSRRPGGRCFSWEDPMATLPTPATSEDRYTPIPVRRHRTATRARALGIQVFEDDLGPMPTIKYKEEESELLKSILEMPTPDDADADAEEEEEEEGKKKRRSVIAVLLDSIKDYLEKVFGSSSDGRQEELTEAIRA